MRRYTRKRGLYQNGKEAYIMPRNARGKSSLNCYHIIARGNNKQDIFYDTKDKLKFIKELRKTKEKYQYNLYAYALMPNHIHLAIKENQDSISKIMQSLLSSYAQYTNKKYERIGYVFQDRFHSKPIEDEIYLKNVIRYIHLNPQKAGIAPYSKYEWSSYLEYMKKESKLIDKKEIEKIFEKNTHDFYHLFQKFHQERMNQNTDEEILEYEIKKVLEDEELYHILEEKFGKEKICNLHRLQKEYRDQLLMKIFEIKGINSLQISRVTGINQKLISNCREKYLKLKKMEMCPKLP